MQPQVREQFIDGLKDFLTGNYVSRGSLTVLGLAKELNLCLILDLGALTLEKSFELQNWAVFHNDEDEKIRGARHIGFIPFKACQEPALTIAI